MANESNTLQLTAADAANVGWEKCFSRTVLGTKFAVCIKITALAGKIRVTLTLQIGSIRKEWTFEISGNRCIDIGFGPAKVSLCVSNWQTSGRNVSFTLTFKLSAFGITIFSYSWNITIPLPAAANEGGVHDLEAHFASVDSPESFLAFLKLMAAIEGEEEDGGDDEHDALASGNRGFPCYNGDNCDGRFLGNVSTCQRCRQLGGSSARGTHGCVKCPR